MLSRCQPRVHSLTALAVKVDRRAACSGHPMDSSFLEEGSPTMVEKGMDPSTVFEMCDDDDDNGIHDIKESGVGGGTGAAEAANAASSAAAASLPSGPEGNASLRHRRAGRSVDRAEVKAKRESWMDPPGETESNTLTQAEMESCMQTYTVRASLLLSHLNRVDRVLTVAAFLQFKPFSCFLFNVMVKLDVEPQLMFSSFLSIFNKSQRSSLYSNQYNSG